MESFGGHHIEFMNRVIMLIVLIIAVVKERKR